MELVARRRRLNAVRTGVVVALGLATVLLVSSPGAAATAAPVLPDAVVPAPEMGVALPGAPADPAELARWTAETGGAPDSITWYVAWAGKPAFPAADADRVTAAGALPSITWEPWDPAAGVTQPSYSLARIAAGRHDTYLASWARQVKAWGKPLVIRFAHEMNGSWYPWAAGVNGNTAADYVAAWRRVRSVFDKAKVTNVEWVWAPNVPYPGSVDLGSLYPGDAYVDRVALDGYNWGASQTWSTWQSFAEVFGPGIEQVTALSTRPLYVTEVASTEIGGDKAAWVRDMFAYLQQHPEVRGITWFDFLKETDWRVASSAGSLEAFRAGVASLG